MYIKNILSVSAMPGLYKLVTNRSNGLIVEHILSGKRAFASARKHQFSPLETIAIYTIYDTIELNDVLDRIHAKVNELELPTNASSNDEFASFFAEVVPEYDRDQVRLPDIKRIVKWYKILVEANYHNKEEEE